MKKKAASEEDYSGEEEVEEAVSEEEWTPDNEEVGYLFINVYIFII